MITFLKKVLAAVVFICVMGAAAAHADDVSFADLDTNGDGLLSAQELSSRFSGGVLEAILGAYDADGDGTISESEISDRSARGAEGSADGQQQSAQTHNLAQMQKGHGATHDDDEDDDDDADDGDDDEDDEDDDNGDDD